MLLKPALLQDRRFVPAIGLRRKLSLSLVMLDVVLLSLAQIIAATIWPGEAQRGTEVAIALIVLYVGTALERGVYMGENFAFFRRARLRRMVLAPIRTFFVAFALLLAALFLLKWQVLVSRAEIFLSAIIFLGMIFPARWGWAYLVARNWPRGVSRVGLIVDEPNASPGREFSVVVEPGDWLDPERDNPDMYERLSEELRGCDAVVVACRPERRGVWTNMLRGLGMRIDLLAPELLESRPVALGQFYDTPSLVIDRGPMKLADRVSKRALDLIVSVAALILLAPILIGAAIAIKLDSKGPVLFKQQRLGLANRRFQMLKFRSMRTDSLDANGTTSTSRTDDRVTKVGRFLRRTSIDELPQLYNVLVGNMSIVGPRPHALESKAEDALFWEIDSRYWHRHKMKPGLTGLAQIRGYRGATETSDQLVNRLESDLEYVQSWSLVRDLTIIAQTLRVLVHPNAY
ncbi:Undecaprenyl-phosphate glucose phosphotransferase [Alteripontixanthobacter maritimus]|uniref:Undecaprenyl-phosphate glucose phosphotransferase n=1 Tax=Alteripontixanthobacter maritimus TaxID=2161824 RepID=A0A369Q962_9SPHN|nr:sugar transferase [Alteripontixanthobacter maritimus]RDC59706.1 Undecaprenyl-phosphate glucose phosphotransferase [Alteripontixanthobacter maritimus]